MIVRMLTHRPFQTGRFELVKRTYESIKEAFPEEMDFAVGMNGPPGFTPEEQLTWVKTIRHPTLDLATTNHDPGSGRLRLLEFALDGAFDNQIIVLSDDDMFWSHTAGFKLSAFWSNEPPADLMILGGYLEPLWDWNIPRGRVDVGGQRAIWRDSAPGCAWTSTAARWKKMLDIGIPVGFGSDYAFCTKLRDLDLRVAQMNLADHIGWEHSTHGNRSIENAAPFDKKKWGIE